MFRRILPWLAAAALVPLAAVVGSQVFPREVVKTKPVLVKPKAGWSAERIEAVFSGIQPYNVQAQDGISCSSYASSAQPPTWAVNLCAQVASGPAG